MNDLYNKAIILIYPDGKKESKPIDNKIFHMRYFLELYKESPNFKEILDQSKYTFFNKNDFTNVEYTYSIDLELAKKGIIAIHNLNIKEINDDKFFLKKYIPNFIFTMPKELTHIQKEIINQLLNESDLHNSFFQIYDNESFIDTNYEKITNFVHQKKH